MGWVEVLIFVIYGCSENDRVKIFVGDNVWD